MTVGGGKEVIAIDSGSETESDHDLLPATTTPRESSLPLHSKDRPPGLANSSLQDLGTNNVVSVLKLSWYKDSLNSGGLLPYDNYLVYQGKITSGLKHQPGKVTVRPKGIQILTRAKEDAPPPNAKRSHGRHTSRASRAHYSQLSSQPALLHETTVEHEGTDMLPIPDFLHTIYSCQRPTPLHCPNEAFLAQLRIIKQARKLEHEEMRSRAYSGGIATIASYPHTLMSAREVYRLPNCGGKIATLWREWHETGHIAEVDRIESDPRMQALNIFYGIHDVGDSGAKKFYERGWRDLDDVIEFGWDNVLTRNQQIGVKYYDEFQLRISRTEVESTANIILDYANRIRDGFQMVICGGYRRGKSDCGDVDVVLTHPDEEATSMFLQTLLENLEEDSYITHRLTVSTRNSDRGQSPVSWKGKRKAGSGFDTLDHAFVVWQNTQWPSQVEDLKKDPNFKNPNPHRRVDIIVTPWKTAGCAIIGWSGGTMFERDLRKYCNDKLNLKFDSSGVRKREGYDEGAWVDLEAGDGDLLVKEKRVFSGLGLEWRDPTERCTD
ncbi:Nucleotidyltransferase [Mollisia scopiformis]|uniref:DNA polymerase n=1 Tax=Mollisia scopiformis TaxID=149040 RepID=A0A132B5Z1_MOLSC|nr:Nucleotidyltransferase [Mollisia scopiformis]KUJ07087.1 Nucleotidyltransferase [Mollisia scopiformis]